MVSDGARLGMSIHVRAYSIRRYGFEADADTTLWAHDVLDEERLLADHGPPTGFVPTNGTVIEADVEMSEVVQAE